MSLSAQQLLLIPQNIKLQCTGIGCIWIGLLPCGVFITHIYSQNISEILDKSHLKPVALWPGTFYFLALGKAWWRLSCPASPVSRQKGGVARLSLSPGASQAIGTVLKEAWDPDWWHCCTDTTQAALPAFFHMTAECKVFYQNGGVPLIGPMKSEKNEEGINLCMSAIQQVHFCYLFQWVV